MERREGNIPSDYQKVGKEEKGRGKKKKGVRF